MTIGWLRQNHILDETRLKQAVKAGVHRFLRDKTNSRFIERNKEEMIKEVIKDRKRQHYSGLPSYCDVTASPQSQQLGNYY